MLLFKTILTKNKFLFRNSIFKLAMSYTTVERGQLNTLGYRVYVKDTQTNQFVSPFHDISLFQNRENNVFNMVVEIPRWTNAKMEIDKKDRLNPIVQDVKSNKLRFVNNCFPHHGYIWNYGALPQTYEDPSHVDETTQCNGDNDPLDVCEIGSRIHGRGAVVGVKVLGALGLIDEGEADWKIIAIDVTDPLAERLNDINDVETVMPGLLEATRDWFRIYKIPTGKPANNFALDGRFLDRQFALKQIDETNALWRAAFSEPERLKNVSLYNTTLADSGALRLSNEDAERVVSESSEAFNPEPAVLDRTPIDAVHYVDRSKL